MQAAGNAEELHELIEHKNLVKKLKNLGVQRALDCFGHKRDPHFCEPSIALAYALQGVAVFTVYKQICLLQAGRAVDLELRRRSSEKF